MDNPTGDTLFGTALIATASLAAGATGISPETVAFAVTGAILGEGAAPPMGMVRKTLVLFASVLAASLMGTIAALHFNAGNLLLADLWALGINTGFHPLLAVFLRAMPVIGAAVREVALVLLRGIGGVK
jgi:hypothetical protein